MQEGVWSLLCTLEAPRCHQTCLPLERTFRMMVKEVDTTAGELYFWEGWGW